ncbi:MAG TPA: hypothetical protein VFK33_17510 [Bacillales bacterium]|nr:hypothetical protein [Bacillales bacterium]
MSEKDVTMNDLMVAIQGVDAKIEGFKHEVNQRFEQVDKRFDEMQKETNDRFDKVDGKLDNLKDHLKFVQKKSQDNEKEIFLLKEKIK